MLNHVAVTARMRPSQQIDEELRKPSPVKSPPGIFSGPSGNTANSLNDQIVLIPPNGPPEKAGKRRLSASSATTADKASHKG
jgi:hypothetical protein